MFKALSPWLALSVCSLGYLGVTKDPASAQVTSDGTVNTQVTENGNTAEITGGETRGNNLFHSFQDFSVRTGNEAFFNNADSISNIFSRVTGGKVSDIDGAIRANGSANLFLINPAGIVFGENASLNIGGSFYGSSASSILFEDGEFSATDLENPPMLTINAPIGLGFRDNPAPIENNSKADAGSDPAGVSGYFGLRVPDGKSFALAGGDITANGGGIITFGGRIDLAAIGGEGTLGLTSNGSDFSFSFPGNLPRGDVSLTNQAGFLVAAGGGGDIVINARNIDIENNSSLSAGILSNLGSIDSQAGDIRLDASETLTIVDSSSAINNQIFSEAVGNAGNIDIQTKTLSVNNSQISASTFGKGNGGDLIIDASETIMVNGELPSTRNGTGSPGGLFAQIDLTGEGKAGNIDLNTGLLSVSNGSKVQVGSFNRGNAGNLTIRANQIKVFNDPSVFSDFVTGIFSSLEIDPLTENPPEGSAGNVNIETQALELNNGGNISVSTSGIGDAGSLKINAEDSIEISGIDPDGDGNSILKASVDSGATGKGGDLRIDTKNLILKDGGLISTDTFGEGDAGNLTVNVENFTVQNSQISASTKSEGNAGNLTVNASESIELSGEFLDENGNPIGPGGLLAQSDLDATGKGGNLTVGTQRLSISNGSKIQAATFNNGDAGEIEIRASEIDLFNTANASNQFPTEISAGSIRDVQGRNANSPLEGDGGSATIETERLSISNGARINVRSDGQGNSGSLNLQTNNLTLSDRAKISVANAFGEGGNINLKINDTLTMLNNSLISVQAFREADGGNLEIDANFIVAYPSGGSGNDLVATSDAGNGGNINLTVEKLFGLDIGKAIDDEANPIANNSNDIDASSNVQGLDGTVNINTSTIDPLQGATELPSNIVEAKQTTEQTCSASREGKTNNGLAIAGRGGVTPPPDAPLNSENINNENPAQANISEPIETAQGKIQPARGIKFTKDGRIILTAYPTDNAGERIPEVKNNCGQI